MCSDLLRYLRLPPRKKYLLLLALFYLCWAFAFVRLLSFKYVAAQLGTKDLLASAQLPQLVVEKAKGVAWAIRIVGRRLPWKSTCLVSALAGQSWLRKIRVPATVYLGVNSEKLKESSSYAHAWLQCGDDILIGKKEAVGFKPIVFFGTKFSWQDGN